MHLKSVGAAQGKRIKKRPRTDDELDGGPAYPSGGGQQFQITTTGRGGRWEEEGSGPRSGRKKAAKRASVSPLEKPWLNLAGKGPGGAEAGVDAGTCEVNAASVLLGSKIMSASVEALPSSQGVVIAAKQDPSATTSPGPAADGKVAGTGAPFQEKGMTAAAVLLAAKPGEEGGAVDAPCVLCNTGVKTWCVMPCGHKALCEKCAHAYFETVPRPFDKCPLCQ